MNLDAYFSRIGYTGPHTATLETLRAIQLHQVGAIPFENLDVLLGRGISLDLEVIEQKLIQQRRGGYCFEQNTLLEEVLRSLGFSTAAYLGRVRWQVPAERRTPLTHKILVVEIDGRPWLADVGFGSIGATAPLALDTDEEQPTPHEPRRIIQRGDYLVHQVRINECWNDVYEFRLEPPAPFDFEMGNWFSCSHPKAHFMNSLVVTRAEGERRVILFNRELTIRHRDGRVEQHAIATPEELLAVLAREFDLHFPAGTRFGPPDRPWPT